MLIFFGGYILEYRGFVEVKVCFISMVFKSYSLENSFNFCYKNLFIFVFD